MLAQLLGLLEGLSDCVTLDVPVPRLDAAAVTAVFSRISVMLAYSASQLPVFVMLYPLPGVEDTTDSVLPSGFPHNRMVPPEAMVILAPLLMVKVSASLVSL